MKLLLLALIAGTALLCACAGSGQVEPGSLYDAGRGTREPLAQALARPELKDLALYAALSENAYSHDLKTGAWLAEPVADMKAFCKSEDVPLLPAWLKPVPRKLYVTPKAPKYGWNVGGLGYALYVEALASGRNRVYLVFRGTDSTQWGDWWSNLRWVSRVVFFLHDEYDQFLALQEELYAGLRQEYGADMELVTLGHSLGGGLAQLAAYAYPVPGETSAVRGVYAFDPSPVSGFYSVESTLRARNASGLNIWRVYDKGEVLAYLRAFMRVLYPLSHNNPRIEEVRFNLLRGHPIRQHSMRAMACALWEASGGGEPAPPQPGR